jgi:hypothetical protein
MQADVHVIVALDGVQKKSSVCTDASARQVNDIASWLLLPLMMNSRQTRMDDEILSLFVILMIEF